MPVSTASESSTTQHLVTSTPDRERPVSLLLAAPVTTCWAAVVGIAPVLAVVLLVWAADSRSTAPASTAIRITLDGWLLAHGARLSTVDSVVGLPPLLWTIFIVWQLWRAGISTSKAIGASQTADVIRVATALAVIYGGLGVAAAWYGKTPGVHVTLWVAGLVTGAVGAGVGALTALHVSGGIEKTRTAIPNYIHSGLKAGLAAVLAVIGAGALLAGIVLALRAELARDMISAPTPGLVGGAGLLLLSVVYVPTVIGWSFAYVLGPGFAIGVGTSVTPWQVKLGPIPAFPLLATVPADSNGPRMLLIAIPILCGITSGMLLARHLTDQQTTHLFAAIGIAAATAGIACAVLALASGGPLGSGRLTAVGPSAWQVTLAAIATIGLGALLGATATRWLIPWCRSWRKPKPSPAEEEPSPANVSSGNDDPLSA